jgi:hypothetical protein
MQAKKFCDPRLSDDVFRSANAGVLCQSMCAASNADKGVVRTFLEAWSEGDLDRDFALTDPDGVVWRFSFSGDISTVRVNLFETVSSVI